MSTTDIDMYIRRIELLVLDVDGVMTDGSITFTPDGAELKTFHVRDGSAIAMWRKFGRSVAIVSGRSSPAVSIRAAELGIDLVHLGVRDKRAALEDILRATGARAEQACAVGDDLPDLPVLTAVGLPVAVADACIEVRNAAKYVTLTAGGRGAIREVIELILRTQGHWNDLINRYR
jgi:3-deoxy-D-manno-octulosonate 8-phosphate phosphatase (KDO 8-P phosphatase)